MRGIRTSIALAIALILTIGGRAAAQQTLILINGDRVSGTLHKIDGTIWVVRYLDGEIKVPAGQIRTFSTTTPIGVRLNDGTIGVLAASPTQMEIRLANGTAVAFGFADLAAVGSADDLEGLRVVRIGLFSPIRRFWSAIAAFGFTDKSGNSRARAISAVFDLERKTSKDRFTLQGAMHRESSQPPGGAFEQTVGKYFGAARVDVYVSTAFFVFVETRQERDRFQDLQLRSIYDGGLGLQVIATKHTDLRFSGGGGFQKDNYITAPSSSGGILAVSGAFRQHAGPLRFAWQVDWNPRIATFADYHLRSDASLAVMGLKRLGLRLALLDEFSSRPLPGVQKHDRLVALAVTYSLGK